jgi:predicted short-subunit dehydrogenase-like oxidoreductase (DUF2520 family)
MRELERRAADSPTADRARSGREGGAHPEAPRLERIGIVGRGRVGSALARALAGAGYAVEGPAGRGEAPHADALILCVPDSEIATAAEAAAGAAPIVGHTSGATPLSALAAAGAETFGLHPLQTIAGAETELRGCGCAIAGGTPRAEAAARSIAERLGMVPFAIDDSRRAAYHAAASIASNFLVTLEAAAESVAAGAGIGGEEARRLLAPLVRTTVQNWASLGPERALTGPVARGDDATVARQREAVARTAPELLELFDALVERTRALAGATPTGPTEEARA